MELPSSINPSPVREALVEVRFIPSRPEDAVFGILYERFESDYPEVEKLPISQLSEDQIPEGNEFSPHYRLPGDPYAIQVGPRVLSVVNRGEYQGWEDFSSAVIDVISEIHDTGIVEETVRYSVRYTNFFEGSIFEELQLDIQSGDKDLVGEETYLRTLMEHGDQCSSVLQITNSARLRQEHGESSGSVIDIDTFATEQEEEDFFEDPASFLDNAHRHEKNLFFGLLTDEFLESLNPQY